MPTDLLGIVTAKYDSEANGGELVAAMGTPCSQINRAIKEQLKLERQRKDAEKKDQLQVATESNAESLGVICSADWHVSQQPNKAEHMLNGTDKSDLFFVLISVVDCEMSRIAVAQTVVEFDTVRIDAMYDLLGAWDLLVKFHAPDEDTAKSFYECVLDALKQHPKGAMVDDDDFSRRLFVNVVAQSRTFAGLTTSRQSDEMITYTLLENSDEYEEHRASRAFVYLDAADLPESSQRKGFLNELEKSMAKFTEGRAIIESICEGSGELIIETFSSCAQSNHINHLNKALEPVLTSYKLQKYTLSCYHYDESGLLQNVLGGTN